MPTAKFVVEVSVRKRVANSNSTSMCAADASQYLAYADQTDLFGYHGAVENVSLFVSHNAYVSVEITFAAPVAQESDIRDFLNECDTLARVEDAKCVTNPNL